MSFTLTESVSIESVRTSIQDAVSAGRIGQPVNVRLHWQAGPQADGVTQAASTALQLAESILNLNSPAVTTRSVEGGQMLHALVRDDSGRSALITVATGEPQTLAVTVYGNHGVIRLEETGFSV